MIGSRHIFVGESRVATKRTREGESNLAYEQANTFWYHSDHLGSAQLVSTEGGREYERIEYTPYGELWIEEKAERMEQDGKTAFRFTGKELDEETGFYYYGARYLNPKTSMWISADPAMGDYIPSAPVNEEARKRNGNLPGMGGVFNYVNMHVYHYAGNNPVKLIDPDGRMQKDPDGYVLFNKQEDTLQDAFRHAGYTSIGDAANQLGLSIFYDQNGNYIGKAPEGKLLNNLVLKPTEESRNNYLVNNYSNIIQAEIYAAIAASIAPESQGASKFESLRDFGLGELIDKVFGIGFLWNLATNTPDSLGMTGKQLFLRDVKINNRWLSFFHQDEWGWGYRENVAHNYSFSLRERSRRETNGWIEFDLPYLDE
jgi:RHS repeat-associated protein